MACFMAPRGNRLLEPFQTSLSIYTHTHTHTQTSESLLGTAMDSQEVKARCCVLVYEEPKIYSMLYVTNLIP